MTLIITTVREQQMQTHPAVRVRFELQPPLPRLSPVPHPSPPNCTNSRANERTRAHTLSLSHTPAGADRCRPARPPRAAPPRPPRRPAPPPGSRRAAPPPPIYIHACVRTMLHTYMRTYIVRTHVCMYVRFKVESDGEWCRGGEEGGR